jgi:hypothetical protein
MNFLDVADKKLNELGFYNYNNEKAFLFFLMGQPKDNKHTSSFDLCVFLFL